jgi:DNA-binding MarR family transcriptional regulator
MVSQLNIKEAKEMSLSQEAPLGRRIYDTAQDIRNIAQRILNPYDLTVEQMHLLKNMSLDTGITQKALGDLVNKSPANLTRILDRLEMKALIARKPDPGDRRAYLVFLTASGMALVKDVEETFQNFSVRLMRGISDETVQIVTTCLKTISANIEQMTLEL